MPAERLPSRPPAPPLVELWRPSLDLALHRNRQEAGVRLVQLATVRTDLRPSIRTVVFRGFLDASSRLLFTIDVRSAKRAEIEANPNGAICWYFPKTREQFRLAGELNIVDSKNPSPELQQIRAAVWAELSEETRATFNWPQPGETRAASTPYPTGSPSPANIPVDVFALLILQPVEVDHLKLQGTPQHRWMYQADALGRWVGREVNP